MAATKSNAHASQDIKLHFTYKLIKKMHHFLNNKLDVVCRALQSLCMYLGRVEYLP